MLGMQKEYLIEVEDAVIAVRDASGRVKLNQLLHPAASGAVSGAFWGMLIGWLFMMPLAGAAVGAAGGALGGTMVDPGINDDDMRKQGRPPDRHLGPGHGGGHAVPLEPRARAGGVSATTALGLELSTFTADTNGQDALRFLRGSRRSRSKAARSATARSSATSSTSPHVRRPRQRAEPDPTYFTFAATTANRPPIVYVGANDGMLHAFDAGTGSSAGRTSPTACRSN